MSSISVLVVDDSVVIRRLVTDVLAGEPDIEVAGTAANGRIALAKIPQLNPDLVTLDIEMPEMDGLETLRRLRAAYPRLPVIMFSTLTERGATASLDALELGAQDYVTKPANLGSVQASMQAVRDQLAPKIRSLCVRRDVPATPVQVRPRPVAPAPASGARRGLPPEVVLIGVSTGGPDALTTVLSALPGSLRVPVVVVQHMPRTFTRLLAERLDKKSALSVGEAVEGEPVVPGRVLLAPGDFHLRLRRTPAGVVTVLDQGTPENFCRPAVDVLFRSAVTAYGGRCLGVVLTGMGHDGTRGAQSIVDAGGEIIAQDERTSVVWGMPGAVTAAGLVTEVLPLPGVAAAVTRRVEGAAVKASGVLA
ncbi:MAG TPA: chemotaxis response regulator protein-glutamate methylesterase [Marmoricola sp.]|nr:chemotaxis response regulator protein-glutamate methylesterase [Marmoricola sp.]